MNLIDIITIIILIITGMIGFYRGAIRVILGLVFFVGALLLTTLLTPLVGEILSEYIYNQLYTMVISNFISFTISSIACTILSMQTSKLIRSLVDTGLLDKVFGLFLGIMNGIIICLVLYFILAFVSTKSYIGSYNHDDIKLKINKNIPKWLENSNFFTMSQNLITDLTDLIPENRLEEMLRSINSSKGKEKQKMQQDK